MTVLLTKFTYSLRVVYREIMQAAKEKELRAARSKPDLMQQVKDEIQKLDNQNALLQVM